MKISVKSQTVVTKARKRLNWLFKARKKPIFVVLPFVYNTSTYITRISNESRMTFSRIED